MNYIYFHDQMLVGSVFGGASLTKSPNGKNYYLSMRSSNKKWLHYKCCLMNKYFPEISINQYHGTYRVNSISSKDITHFHDCLYDGNVRFVNEEILDRVSDTMLATWYLDNGGRIGRNKKNMYLNSTIFGKEGSEKIHKFFCSLGVDCNLNEQKNRIKITFTVSGSLKFYKIIQNRVPLFMEEFI